MSFERTDRYLSEVDSSSKTWTIAADPVYPWPTVRELGMVIMTMLFFGFFAMMAWAFALWLVGPVISTAFAWISGALVMLVSLWALYAVMEYDRVAKTSITLTPRHLTVCVHGRGFNADRTERFELHTLQRAFSRPMGKSRSRIELQGVPGDPKFDIAVRVDIGKVLCDHIELAAIALREPGSEQEIPPSLQSIRKQRPVQRQAE